MSETVLFLTIVMIVGLAAVAVGLGALGWQIFRGSGNDAERSLRRVAVDHLDEPPRHAGDA